VLEQAGVRRDLGDRVETGQRLVAVDDLHLEPRQTA
jgi:hypothetical protein